MTENVRVLIIDDEQVIREGCDRSLSSLGYVVSKAENGHKGIELMKQDSFDVVLLDLMMPGIDGFEVLAWIKQNSSDTQVIVITGFATVSKAVTAMKQGAFDFVGKPFTPDYIRIVVSRALEKRALEEEAEKLREEKALDLMTIAEGQSRLKTVFSGMIEAALITNTDLVVVHHNPAAIKILDIQTDPVIGKVLSTSIRDTDLIDMIQESVSNASAVTREFPPGTISRKYLRAHAAPVCAAGGKTLGSVTVFEDITTHKEIDRMKSEFVAMVAHELRAPLASIEQMIYALTASCEFEKPESCIRLHGRMSERTKDLLRLIENLLNLSRLETGTVVFNMEPLIGDEIITDVVDILQTQADTKNIELLFAPSSEKWWFNVDHDHIRGAIMNILSNAIKYTPDGGRVEINSTVAQGLAKVEVSDSGIGISEEDLPNIFERFFRVKDRETRRITGSGLGLSVVKKVVDAHKGFVDVRSVKGEGTSFTLSFPLAEQPSEKADALSPTT